jgi:site-specific recombinase XerD
MILDRSFALHWRAKGQAEETLSIYLMHLRRFEEQLGRDSLTATRADCETYILGELDRTSPATAHYAWRALRAYFKWLRSEDEIEIDPTAKIKAPKVPETVTRIASADDVDALMRAIPLVTDFQGSRDRALVRLFWATGLRRAEMCRLTLDDIDLSSRTLVVRQSKNGTVRVVPFDQQTALSLDRYLRKRSQHPAADKPHLWLGLRGRVTEDGMSNIIERLAARAGVEVTCHSFRRGLAARWIREGGGETMLRVVAGWKSPQMVQRYVRGAQTELAIEQYRRLIG